MHPFFKNFAFHGGRQTNSRLRNDIIDQLSDELQESDEYSQAVPPQVIILKSSKIFFKDKGSGLPSAKSNTTSKSMLTPKQIINSYLMSDDSLKSFPLIQNLFINYNTAIKCSL